MASKSLCRDLDVDGHLDVDSECSPAEKPDRTFPSPSDNELACRRTGVSDTENMSLVASRNRLH
jgi:hypothetical protein